jgi:DNA-binding transcriptional ArsR family regulator
MPKKGKRKKRKRTVDQAFVKSLAHELRAEILMILTERMASPNELAKVLDEGLSQVSYHVKVLKDYRRIKLVKTEPRRGAVEHFYRATAGTLLPAPAWRAAKGLRTVVGGGMASDLFDDLADAVEAQKLTEENSHIKRLLLLLDEDGREKVSAIIEQATQEVEEAQEQSFKRVKKAKGQDVEMTPYTVGLFGFEDCRQGNGNPQDERDRESTSTNGKGASSKRGRAGKGVIGSQKKKAAKGASGGKRKSKRVGK